MNKSQWLLRTGLNSQTIEFQVLDLQAQWNPVPGIYIFCKVENGIWHPLYIGQTDNFSDRLPNHERRQEAIRSGASHIHARVVQNAAERDQIEKILIQTYNPPLNTQHTFQSIADRLYNS